jgi:hypothetical protein
LFLTAEEIKKDVTKRRVFVCLEGRFTLEIQSSYWIRMLLLEFAVEDEEGRRVEVISGV